MSKGKVLVVGSNATRIEIQGGRYPDFLEAATNL